MNKLSMQHRFCVAEPGELRKDLADLGQADIVVGIPSYNEADSIAHVVEQSGEGLKSFSPNFSGVIVNVDNHSSDDTRRAFLGSNCRVPRLYISTPPGVKGKGNNFYNLFQAARFLEAKVVVVVDADLVSITPEWIRRLASPVLQQDFGCVTPLYARNEYDGTVTNNIAFPLIYALAGRRIRQPIGGDFALAKDLVDFLLEEEWQESSRQYGIDTFLTMSAVQGGFRIGQVPLGAKIHKPSAPKLGPMFSQVVTTLFSMLIHRKEDWFTTGAARVTPVLGRIEESEPQPLAVDYKSIKRMVLQQYQEQREQLAVGLQRETFGKIDSLMSRGRMGVSAGLWSRTVYELLHRFDRTSDPAWVEALKPLFFARTASFYRQTLDLEHGPSEARIQSQAAYFRRSRGYLSRLYQEAEERHGGGFTRGR